MSISQWCRTIARIPRGRVLLRNLIYDLDRERIRSELVKPLMDHLCEGFADAPTVESAVELIEGFRKANIDEYTCAGRGGPPHGAPCSRVLDEGSAFFFNIDATHYGIPAEDEPPPWFFERLSAAPLDPKGVHGQMNTGRGFVWVTRREDFEQLINEGPKANLARRGLGLDYIGSDMRLLALHYPEELPWSARSAPPTVIEGGANAVYRSTEGDDGWGRAVDLETLEDGLPELTHEPVDFTASFEIETLGLVGEGPEPSAETLADATAPQSGSWLEEAIVKLLEHAENAGHERTEESEP